MHQQPKRVLVIDDDGAVRSCLSSLLIQDGLAVDAAACASEALALIDERPYAVILLDLIMPLPGGAAVLEALQTTRRQHHPVIIAMTEEGAARPGHLDPAVVHGVISKPFDSAEVAALVGTCAEIRSLSTFERMAVTAAIAGAPLIAFLANKV